MVAFEQRIGELGALLKRKDSRGKKRKLFDAMSDNAQTTLG